jgi:hypothetical protein
LAEENTFSQFPLFQGSDSSFEGSERKSPDDVAEANLLLNLLLGTEPLNKGTGPLNKEDPLEILVTEDPLEILNKEDSSKLCSWGIEVEKLVIKEIKVEIVQVIQEVEGKKIVPQIEYREDLETIWEVEVEKMVQVMNERQKENE